MNTAAVVLLVMLGQMNSPNCFQALDLLPVLLGKPDVIRCCVGVLHEVLIFQCVVLIDFGSAVSFCIIFGICESDIYNESYYFSSRCSLLFSVFRSNQEL